MQNYNQPGGFYNPYDPRQNPPSNLPKPADIPPPNYQGMHPSQMYQPNLAYHLNIQNSPRNPNAGYGVQLDSSQGNRYTNLSDTDPNNPLFMNSQVFNHMNPNIPSMGVQMQAQGNPDIRPINPQIRGPMTSNMNPNIRPVSVQMQAQGNPDIRPINPQIRGPMSSNMNPNIRTMSFQMNTQANPAIRPIHPQMQTSPPMYPNNLNPQIQTNIYPSPPMYPNNLNPQMQLYPNPSPPMYPNTLNPQMQSYQNPSNPPIQPYPNPNPSMHPNILNPPRQSYPNPNLNPPMHPNNLNPQIQPYPYPNSELSYQNQVNKCYRCSNSQSNLITLSCNHAWCANCLTNKANEDSFQYLFSECICKAKMNRDYFVLAYGGENQLSVAEDNFYAQLNSKFSIEQNPPPAPIPVLQDPQPLNVSAQYFKPFIQNQLPQPKSAIYQEDNYLARFICEYCSSSISDENKRITLDCGHKICSSCFNSHILCQKANGFDNCRCKVDQQVISKDILQANTCEFLKNIESARQYLAYQQL